MKYSEEFIEETLKENVNLRLQYFEEKEKRQKSEERYRQYRREISKEAQNKNKEQVLRERDILQNRIDKAIEYIRQLEFESEELYDISEIARLELLDILKGS